MTSEAGREQDQRRLAAAHRYAASSHRQAAEIYESVAELYDERGRLIRIGQNVAEPCKVGEKGQPKPPLSFSDWLQGTSGIVSALGVFLALFFVAINSAYVYFYEMLGVTPEDVGFDRLAILARTAGMLLPASILGALILAIYHFYPTEQSACHIWVQFGGVIIAEAVLIVLHVRAHLPMRLDLVVTVLGFLVGVLFLVCLAKLFRPKNLYLTAACWGLAVLVLLIGVRASLITFVRPQIGNALIGQPVRLIELIDFQATPAHVKWVDPSKKKPILLEDPDLLYLGHGPRGEVLFACGNVVTVPSDSVIVEDGFHLLPPANAQDRKAFCAAANNY